MNNSCHYSMDCKSTSRTEDYISYRGRWESDVDITFACLDISSSSTTDSSYYALNLEQEHALPELELTGIVIPLKMKQTHQGPWQLSPNSELHQKLRIKKATWKLTTKIHLTREREHEYDLFGIIVHTVTDMETHQPMFSHSILVVEEQRNGYFERVGTCTLEIYGGEARLVPDREYLRIWERKVMKLR
jgi:hypothetical protein